MNPIFSAPSNIALIKYMGKIEGQGNQPTNSSLSWTLDHLRSYVRITPQPGMLEDQWAPLQADNVLPLPLGEGAIARFLKHFDRLKREFQIDGSFLIESANDFPSDCGLASSASSFAALTTAAVESFIQMGNQKASELGMLERADLSRSGSGSSCRSFFGPWALWFKEGVRPLEFPMRPLRHQVIVVEAGAKAVSSSEAHRKVMTSPHFQGRQERAEERLAQLIHLFRNQGEQLENWKQAAEIVWDEFEDMHRLFETSTPDFSYRTSKTHEVLKDLKSFWQTEGDGPLVTMDAGANVHLLYRQDQDLLAKQLKEHFSRSLKVFSSERVTE